MNDIHSTTITIIITVDKKFLKQRCDFRLNIFKDPE